MADSKDYTNVSSAAVDCLKNDLRSMGIDPPEGDTGAIEYQGVKLTIAYAPADKKLSVQIISRPSFVPASLVWQLLDGRIQKCIGQ
jgi:hypothetical protein